MPAYGPPPAAAGGYVQLAPLPPGAHVTHFFTHSPHAHMHPMFPQPGMVPAHASARDAPQQVHFMMPAFHAVPPPGHAPGMFVQAAMQHPHVTFMNGMHAYGNGILVAPSMPPGVLHGAPHSVPHGRAHVAQHPASGGMSAASAPAYSAAGTGADTTTSSLPQTVSSTSVMVAVDGVSAAAGDGAPGVTEAACAAAASPRSEADAPVTAPSQVPMPPHASMGAPDGV
ncbi:hypothetical protein EON68_02745, partial [archaeon]